MLFVQIVEFTLGWDEI